MNTYEFKMPNVNEHIFEMSNKKLAQSVNSSEQTHTHMQHCEKCRSHATHSHRVLCALPNLYIVKCDDDDDNGQCV